MRTIESMGPGELLSLISREPEGERLERMRAAMLALLIEEEVQWRTNLRHQNVGYHKASPCAGHGEGRGECTGLVDHVGLAAERYRYESRWRSMARALLAHLPERQQMAVLITGYVITPQGGNQSPRMMTLAQACERQAWLLQVLGWSPSAGYGAGEWVKFRRKPWQLGPNRFDRLRSFQAMRCLTPGSEKPFASTQAIKHTARRGRERLLDVVAQQASLAA